MMMLTGCEPKQQKGTDGFLLPAVDDIAMYQVNPRVFAPQNSLRAVAGRIDSIQELGVNVVWVMPIYPIGIEKGKNSPYCISDYTAVAPEFGTIDDFKHLVQVCHDHGMGIILDWVANHTAWDHPWVSEHPDWYTHDEETDTIIHPRPWDWLDVADLNYDNRDMRRAMTDAMLFWVKEVGIDGFRCDVADGVPADFWRDAIQELRQAAQPRRIVMLAEGKNVDNFTVGGFDMNYGWDFKDSLVHVFRNSRPASDLLRADSAEYAQLPAGKVKLRFTTNHDHSTELAAYVASVFLHGGALIYGSQEVGYPDPINFFHYVAVDWTANPQLYNEYKELIKLYNDHPALRKGQLEAWPAADALVFEKRLADERFLVVVNVRNRPVVADIPSTWAGMKVEDEITGRNLKLGQTLNLAAYEYLIFEPND